MKGRILSVLLNPFVLAFLLWIPIIGFLPNIFDRYVLELENERLSGSDGRRVFYEDLNNDGTAEEIRAETKSSEQVRAIVVRKYNDAIVDQWNLKGKFLFEGNNGADVNKIDFLDYDKDGFSEIYTLTREDSIIYLNCIRPFESKKVIYSKPIVRDYYNELENDISYNRIHLADLDLNGSPELVFALNTGYNVHPRRIYAYNPKQDSLWNSPFLCNRSVISEIRDITGDGYPELLLSTTSSGNQVDSFTYGCTDYEVRQWVLDHTLQPVFQPPVFHNPFGSVKSTSIIEGEPKIISLISSNQNELEESELRLQDANGNIILENEIAEGQCNFIKLDKEVLVLSCGSGKALFLLNEQLGLSEFASNPDVAYMKPVNIDADEPLELLWLSRDWRSIRVMQDDGKHISSHELPDSDDRRVIMGTALIDHKPRIYVQRDDRVLLFSNGKNPIFGLQYPVYGGIYGGLLGLIFLVIKGQEMRENKKQAIAKDISQLQMRAIKNQVDPHFVFNSINAISAMVQEDDKMTADRFIVQFSNLMRKTLKDSDKISTTLKEELEYIENYIQLQQIRFEDSFDYSIIVATDVNSNRRVPKHVLFTYVENAIKHGLACKREGRGKLVVNIRVIDGKLHLRIEDNGPGKLVSEGHKIPSTGRGMKIMEQIYVLYQQLYKTKIKHYTSELYDNGHVKGHRSEVIFSE